MLAVEEMLMEMHELSTQITFEYYYRGGRSAVRFCASIISCRCMTS